jgi:hypothetical protein
MKILTSGQRSVDNTSFSKLGPLKRICQEPSEKGAQRYIS